MAWIQPNGVVFLYKNVPLLPNYNDTVYFETQAEKDSFFDHYYYKSYSNISYQRVGKNKIRLEGSAEEMYSVNYMSFINNDFYETPKMWYAFVDYCEYINNNVFELTYHVDVMVTWATEMFLEKCFVEREHAESDEIGENLITEPFEDSDYYLISRTSFGLSQMSYIVAFAPLSNLLNDTAYVSGLFSPIQYWAYDANKAGALTINFLLGLLSVANMHDHVLGIYMFPKALFTTGTIQNPDLNNNDTVVITNETPVKVNARTERPDHFVTGVPSASTPTQYYPNNNKMLTAQFMHLSVNDTTELHDFKFENFNDPDNIYFEAYGFISTSPKIAIVPTAYDMQVRNLNQTIIDNNFPSLPVYSNSFIQLLGQNGVLNGLLNLAPIIGGINEMGKIVDSQRVGGSAGERRTETTTFGDDGEERHRITITKTSGTTKSLGKSETSTSSSMPKIIAKELPRIAGEFAIGQNWVYSKGEGGNVLSTINSLYNTIDGKLRDIYLDCYGISAERAKVCDDYLSYYGYAKNEVKIPNRHVRKRWTYVKTHLCKVHGNIPADDLAAISAIFDAGITFWDRHYTVGDYQLNDNGIIHDEV